MVVQLTPVYPPVRRIRVNTVAFDVECVLLLSEQKSLGNPDLYFAVVNGIAFRKADIDKYFMPHQRVNLSFATDPEQFGYLTVVPYGVSYDITHGTEIDPNLTDEIDNDALVSPDDEVIRRILHYKHHTRCLPLSETCFTMQKGGSVNSFGSPIFFTAPTTSTYAWPWFDLTNAPEDLIVIPVPDFLTPYIILYPPNPPDPAVPGAILSLELKCNLGHVVPDCAVRNCIYSTYQVIRGNEYGTRESVIDYLIPQ